MLLSGRSFTQRLQPAVLRVTRKTFLAHESNAASSWLLCNSSYEEIQIKCVGYPFDKRGMYKSISKKVLHLLPTAPALRC